MYHKGSSELAEQEQELKLLHLLNSIFFYSFFFTTYFNTYFDKYAYMFLSIYLSSIWVSMQP